jgi:hypothetical protein
MEVQITEECLRERAQLAYLRHSGPKCSTFAARPGHEPPLRTLAWYKSIHFNTVAAFLSRRIERCSSSVSIKGEVPCVH